MNRAKRLTGAIIAGILWATIPVLLSCILIRNLSGLFETLSGSLPIPKQLAAQIIQALAQLNSAVLASPWLLSAVIGLGMGLLHYVLWGKKAAWFLIAAVLPVTVLFLWFTGVNGIHLGAVLKRLFVLVPELL